MPLHQRKAFRRLPVFSFRKRTEQFNVKMCKAIVVMAQTVVMAAHTVPYSVDAMELDVVRCQDEKHTKECTD